MVKNLPTIQETWILFLDQEDPLEKGMATLQSSCLENSMDRGAWWATVHGIAKSQLMKVKEESEKVGLRLNIQKKKIMSSSPITSRQIEEETMETVTDFIF